jgi:hypothetical protein
MSSGNRKEVLPFRTAHPICCTGGMETFEDQSQSLVETKVEEEEFGSADIDEPMEPAESTQKVEDHLSHIRDTTHSQNDESEVVEIIQDQNLIAEAKKRPRSPSQQIILSEDNLGKKSRLSVEDDECSTGSAGSQDPVEKKLPPVQQSDASRSSPTHAEPKDSTTTTTTTILSVPNNPGVLRADLIAAILGGAPTAGPAPVEVPVPALELTAKKRKDKPPPVKVLKAMKEEKEAKVLLDGKVDLARILPEAECKFLAEKLWIVTSQQLENVLNPKNEEGSRARQELIEALARSAFVSEHGENPPIAQHPESNIDVPVDSDPVHVKEEEEEPLPQKSSSNPAYSGPACLTESAGQDIEVVSTVEIDDEGPLSGAPHSDNVIPLVQMKEEAPETTPDKLCATDRTNVDSDSQEMERKLVKTEETRPPPEVTTPTPVHSDSGSAAISSSDAAETANMTKHDTDCETHAFEWQGEPLPKSQEHDRSPSTSPEPGAIDGSTNTIIGSSCTDSSISAAMQIMESWSDKLKERGQMQSFGYADKQFFLDGPVSFLFPTCTRNFLKSAKIDTVFKFLCLKRTETGIIVDVYAAWRKECKLVERPRISIAKHLVALGARLEALIGSACPLSSKERQWLGDHTIVLGGSAKDFLFDIGIVDAKLFVKMMTKKLSNKLEKWRLRKGLPPLKGTGKVAMVSAWKTQIREAQELELHDGNVLGDDWMKTLPMEQPELPKSIPATKKGQNQPLILKKHDKDGEPAMSGSKRTLTTPRARRTESPVRASKDELESSDFLHALFEKDAINLMTAIGITNGNELLAADTTTGSTLVLALTKARNEGAGDADADASVKQLLDWQISLNLGLAKRRKVSEKVDDESIGKRAAGDFRPTKSGRNSSKKSLSNPWEILSESAKDFLASIDITDAEVFLAGKTKYLAERLVKYRESRNLLPLRGSGAVASVSGWKALVRNAASELGQHELASLNAGRNAGIKLKRRQRIEELDEDVQEKKVSGSMPTLKATPPSRKNNRIDLLTGERQYNPTTSFSVRNGKCKPWNVWMERRIVP